jgi:hypothetical protein
VCNYKHTRLFFTILNLSDIPTDINHFLLLRLLHVKMNVDNLQARTKTFTCFDDYHWLDWANRSQEQDVNTTTHGHARPPPSSTWTTLNMKSSTRFSSYTNYAGGGHIVSPPEPSTRSTLNCLSPLLQQYSPPLHIPLTLSPSLFLPMSTPSISSHFPNTAAFRLYYFDESLTVPLPLRTPNPFLHPLSSWQLSPPTPLSKPTLTNT